MQYGFSHTTALKRLALAGWPAAFIGNISGNQKCGQNDHPDSGAEPGKQGKDKQVHPCNSSRQAYVLPDHGQQPADKG